MAGGQAIDLAHTGKAMNELQLRDMHRRKTGALLQASVLMGAACGEVSPSSWAALQQYGDSLGLAFQVVDDVLDVTQGSETLGKTAGKDQGANKPTYVTVLGLDAAMALARSLRDQAHASLLACGLADTSRLRELADKVVDRDS
jgi:farnesyl diphosphate synthase